MIFKYDDEGIGVIGNKIQNAFNFLGIPQNLDYCGHYRRDYYKVPHRDSWVYLVQPDVKITRQMRCLINY